MGNLCSTPEAKDELHDIATAKNPLSSGDPSAGKQAKKQPKEEAKSSPTKAPKGKDLKDSDNLVQLPATVKAKGADSKPV